MKLYTKTTKISITIQGNGSEIFEYSLPIPHNYTRNGDIYTIEYNINGYFYTTKSLAYLNDILARFTLSMRVLSTKVSKGSGQGIELSLFQGLKSIIKHKNYENVDVGLDNIFWALKLYTEDLIREAGEGNTIAYSLIESFAFSHFIDRAKDRSTLKAKCRSIWNWYNERDWIIPKRKGLGMTRVENAKRVAKMKTEKNYKAVINLITGLYADEYKKKSGSWHYAKIADRLNLNVKTVSKHIKEFEQKNK